MTVKFSFPTSPSDCLSDGIARAVHLGTDYARIVADQAAEPNVQSFRTAVTGLGLEDVAFDRANTLLQWDVVSPLEGNSREETASFQCCSWPPSPRQETLSKLSLSGMVSRSLLGPGLAPALTANTLRCTPHQGPMAQFSMPERNNIFNIDPCPHPTVSHTSSPLWTTHRLMGCASGFIIPGRWTGSCG